MAISTGVNPHRAWLRVNGTDFPIINGTCTEEGTRQSSTFQATIPINYPGAKEALANIGDNSGGVIVESNGRPPTPLIMGEIDTTNFHFGQNGTIVVTGRDNSTKLHNRIHHGQFTDHTTVGIVSELASMAGLGFTATGGAGVIAGVEVSEEFVLMVDGQTFASIITKMAELDNARWFVDNDNVLHYEIEPSPGAGYTVTYQAGPPEVADFFELSIKRNVQAGKTIEVTLKSFDDDDKEVFKGVATVEGNGGPVQYSFQLPNQNEEQAQHYAQSKANEIARHELTVVARVVGDVNINVDDGLEVRGTGIFDQSYLIDSITHQFGMPGHTMSITARAGKGGRGA